MRGDLDTAVESLESALAATPETLNALYPLARVLAERDEHDRALAVLEQAGSLDESGYVVRVFSAVVHYDYGEWALAREAIEGVKENNVIARSLGALLDLETSNVQSLKLHRGALWISETAGRLLAALERRLFARGMDAMNEFHESLVSGEAESEPAPVEVAKDPERFKVDRDWWTALDSAFRTGDHARVTRLYGRKEVPDKWRDAVSKMLNGYSLLALGRAKQALEASRSLSTQNPKSEWAHVLAGLAYTVLEDRRHAIYAFTRAVRCSDCEIHRVIMALAKHLEVSFEFLD